MHQRTNILEIKHIIQKKSKIPEHAARNKSLIFICDELQLVTVFNSQIL